MTFRDGARRERGVLARTDGTARGRRLKNADATLSRGVDCGLEGDQGLAVTPTRIVRVYLMLLVLETLAASLIWGVNTLFLLDAGLSLTGAFVANAAFTAGMVLFEIPTGVLADTHGRRASFLLGAATLLVTTLLYLWLWWAHAGLAWWTLVSALIGLGFTFFSGATEAWLVDALEATGFEGDVDSVFGRGQVAMGAATLAGTIGGGVLAQWSLGVPYLVRSALLVLVIIAAAVAMRDLGFTPERSGTVGSRVRATVHASVQHGLKNPPVRMFMLAAPFYFGVGIWVFYAFQPYLLALFGDLDATWLAGAATAIFASAQMLGGALVKLARKVFATRTGVLLVEAITSALALVGVGLAEHLAIPFGFWLALVLLAVASLGEALSEPLERAYINAVIPSQQRATVLSFASLMGSAGGVVAQPALGRVADVYSLGFGYVAAGALYAVRAPFLLAVRLMHQPADRITTEAG